MRPRNHWRRRGIWGFPFMLFMIIFLVSHSFSGFMIGIGVLVLLALILRSVLPNMTNRMNGNAMPYQPPQQPYQQPYQPMQEPYQQQQPYQPTQEPYQQDYQSYQQGYQPASPPPVYQAPQPPYQYQPPQQSYEEQPQAEYPQEMPPMQQ